MRHDPKILFLLVMLFFLFLLPTPFLALQESTEARYGEIAREMLATGNFLEPSFNGIAHFHKPPLAYWMIAAGMKLFGTNGFGARFFGVAAAVLALFWLYKTALLLLRDEKKALTALLVLASSYLFLIVSRTVETDIYLTCFVIAAQYFLFRQINGPKNRWNTCWYAFFLGLGFLTKGPVVFVFTLIPYLAAKLFDSGHRRAFDAGQIFLGLGVFLTVVLPWFIAVIHEQPKLVRYFLKVQTLDRIATNRFGRSKPFWFFPEIFLATFFPAIIPFTRGLLNSGGDKGNLRVLYIYVLIPFLVFLLSQSKMGPYLLPLYGVATIIAVNYYYTIRSKWDGRIAMTVFSLIPPALFFSFFVYKPLFPVRIYLIGTSIAALAACIILWRIVYEDRFLPAGSIFLIGISIIGYMFMPTLEAEMKGYAKMTARINSLDPKRRNEVIVYRDFLPSLSFYRQKPAMMALGTMRELDFQKNENYRRWYIRSETELKEVVSDQKRVFLVTRPADTGEFEATTSFVCAEIFAQRKYSAYECSPRQKLPVHSLHVQAPAGLLKRMGTR